MRVLNGRSFGKERNLLCSGEGEVISEQAIFQNLTSQTILGILESILCYSNLIILIFFPECFVN